MYESTAVLMSSPVAAYDSYGNETLSCTERTVFVQPRGVYSSEYYSAAQIGLNPSVTFVLTNRADYNGEKLVEFEDELYDVIRVDWTAQRDRISLVCERREADEEETEPDSEEEQSNG